MKTATAAIFLASAMLLSNHAALAAAPKLSGKYTVTTQHVCQVLIATTTDGHLKTITGLFQPHNFKIGTMTFVGSNLSYSGVMIEGNSVIVNGVGTKMSQPTAVTFSGAFSHTATTFSFQNKTFQARYADIDTNGVAHHATFLLRDSDECMTMNNAIRQ